MATTFGFFNAKKVGDDYDRKYSADNLAEYFDPIVGSGVSINEENGYQLKAQSGLNVLLESGFAWIKGYYIRDTTATALTFEAAPSAQSRYDAVVLRLSKANRTVEKLIIKGAEGPTPQPPDLTRTADTYELMLGYVVRKAGTSSITQDMIVDTRGDTSLCGLIDTFAARLIPDGSVTTEKLADGSVTRAKLADDALYSPVVNLSSASYDITANDMGKTISVSYSLNSSDIVLNLTQANSQGFAGGSEIAVFYLFGQSLKIVTTGVRIAALDVALSKNVTLQIPEKYYMIALKKVVSDTSNGDIWTVQGNVEVVT